MEAASEGPLTAHELAELTTLQLARTGQTFDDVSRKLRAQLEALREGRDEPVTEGAPAGPSIEARVAALEAEVKRLRVLAENGSKNG